MLEAILNSNPFALLAIGVVIVFTLMFIFVRPDKKKSKKSGKESDKKQEASAKQEKTDGDEKSKSETAEPEKEQNVTEEVTKETQESTAKSKKKVKKAKTKPEITQVYQRTEKKEVVQEKTADDGISEEMLSKAQFVNTSKKVSKFAGFKEDTAPEETFVEDGLISEEMGTELADNCDDCKRIIKHFDHSRRLSKIIKDDSFDQMFMEHLTEHYMNMDIHRHLRDIDAKIYEKASEMLSNSDAKVLVEDDSSDIPVEQIKNDREFMKTWLETRKRQEYESLVASAKEEYNDEMVDRIITHDVKINAKNLVMASAVMNRKSLKRNKK